MRGHENLPTDTPTQSAHTDTHTHSQIIQLDERAMLKETDTCRACWLYYCRERDTERERERERERE